MKQFVENKYKTKKMIFTLKSWLTKQVLYCNIINVVTAYEMSLKKQIYAGVAELADAPDLGSGVSRRGGSSPFTRISGNGSVVEHRLAKARVASSNLVFRF